MCLPVLQQRMDEPISRQEQLQPLPDGLAGPSWLCPRQGISGARGCDKLQDRSLRDSLAKTFFSRHPQISSEFVLKMAMQHPRTQS